MNKQRPSNGAMLSMAAFTASCIGLLLFLWISFGGSLPLAPEGYRFSVEFDQAVELATQAQVEISGVPIGQVVSVALDHRTGLSRAVIQIDRQFAPRPADTRAILRQKTLLGVAYLAFGPLSGGWLTGKYRRDAPYPADSRMAQRPEPYRALVAEHTFDALEALETFAQTRGATMAGVALAWLLSDDRVTQLVLGPGRPEHLAPLREALESPLSAGEPAELEAVFSLWACLSSHTRR